MLFIKEFSSVETFYQMMYTNVFKREFILPIINNHTDLNLGDCSYLDTCHKLKSCRYLHYYTLTPMKKSCHIVAKKNSNKDK